VAAGEAFESLMPEGPLLYVSVRSVPELIEKVKSAPGYKFLSEPEMQPLMDQFHQDLQRPKEKLARATGANPDELHRVLGGQVCLGILPPEQGEKPSVLVLADVTGDEALAESALGSLIEYLRQERGDSVTVKEETFQGHAVYHLEPVVPEQPEEEPEEEWGEDWDEDWDQGWEEEEDGAPNPAYVSLSDGILAIAVGPDASFLERHLVLRGGGDLTSLSDVGSYRKLDAYLGTDRDLTVYGDFSAIEEAAGASGLGSQPGEVGAFGYAVTLAEDGMAGQGMLLAPAPRQGFLRALVPQSGSIMPPAFVEKDAAAFGGLHFSIPVLYEEIMAMMERENPEQYMAIQQQLQMQPIDIENDVVNSFGGRWFLYAPGGAGDSSGPSIAVVGDLKNAAAFAGAWAQLLATLPPFFQYETVEFMGVTVYQFRMAMPMEGQAEETPQPCVAIMEDKLVYAADLELAKSIIKNDRRATSPMLGDGEFQQLLSRTMDNPDGMLFADGRVIGRWIAERMEEEGLTGGSLTEGLAPPPGMEGMTPDLSLPQMPPWEVMEKYQTPTLVTVKWSDEGLLVKSWSPHPKLEQ
jgi:hypothetical protein